MFVFGLFGLLVGRCRIPATSLYDPPGPHPGYWGFPVMLSESSPPTEAEYLRDYSGRTQSRCFHTGVSSDLIKFMMLIG